MELDGSQQRQLQDALLAAFPDVTSLRQMVRFHLDQPPSSIMGDGSLNEQVFRLIQWAEGQGKFEELIKAALAQAPNSDKLKKFVSQVGLEVTEGIYVNPARHQDGSTYTMEPKLRSQDRTPAQLVGDNRTLIAVLLILICLSCVVILVVLRGIGLPITPAPTPSPTATDTPMPATPTNTAVPPTATNTPVPPTATNTAVPPTATNTPVPPTVTNPPIPSTPTLAASPQQIEQQLASVNVVLTGPGGPHDKILGYLQSDPAYRALVQLILNVLAGRKFLSPVDLDTINGKYIDHKSPGTPYLPAEDYNSPEILKAAILEHWNQIYLDRRANSFEDIVK